MKLTNIAKTIVSVAIALTCVVFSTIPISAYNGSKAAAYAKKYATKYNRNYIEIKGGDCTNFVSQCVKEGGISLKKIPESKIDYLNIGKVFKTEAYWDCNKHTRTVSLAGITLHKKTGFVWTTTWSFVSRSKNGNWGFYQHMKNRGASTKEYSVSTEAKLNTFIKDCSVGDVLQVRSNSSSNKDHSVIVTDKSYDSKNRRYNMKIAYHSYDTAPTDFRTVSWNKFGKSRLWTIIKVSKI